MQIADPSDCNNPLAICDKAMKRLSKLQKLNEEYDGYQIDKGRNIFSNIKEEEKRAAEIVASAQTVMQEKVRGATLEAASKSMSNVATFSPISGMFKAKLANDKAASKIIDSFILSSNPIILKIYFLINIIM